MAIIGINRIFRDKLMGKDGKPFQRTKITSESGLEMVYFGRDATLDRLKEGDEFQGDYVSNGEFKGRPQYKITKVHANPKETNTISTKNEAGNPGKIELVAPLPVLADAQPLTDEQIMKIVEEAYEILAKSNLSIGSLNPIIMAKLQQQDQQFECEHQRYVQASIRAENEAKAKLWGKRIERIQTDG